MLYQLRFQGSSVIAACRDLTIRQLLIASKGQNNERTQTYREGNHLIKRLLQSLIILITFVPFAMLFPFAVLSLCRTPGGAEVVFWLGPWSCCFWALIYSQLSAVPWRQGASAVLEWREVNGGLLHTSIIATGWMFGALFFSYVAEFLLIVTKRGAVWLPVATYSPLAFCWLWRKVHG